MVRNAELEVVESTEWAGCTLRNNVCDLLCCRYTVAHDIRVPTGYTLSWGWYVNTLWDCGSLLQFSLVLILIVSS